MRQLLVITGDGGESYEALYAVHRFREAGWKPVIAAPSRRRLHLVMHDFEPGWDTYIERPGYGLDADIGFDQISVSEYEALLILGGRAPEYLRNDKRLIGVPKPGPNLAIALAVERSLIQKLANGADQFG